jgi:hypothetical protein
MVLPALRDSCLFFVVCLIGAVGNCNFSAMRSPIELKLSGDLALVTLIGVHVLVSSFLNKQEIAKKTLEFSPPFRSD